MARELIRIVYRPNSGPNKGLRHTAWMRWMCVGKPPEDFGVIEKVSVYDPRSVEKVKFVKPSKKDVDAAASILRRRKGFTLLELMIVVAIIGILAAIAIPKFANLIDVNSCNKKGDMEACARVAARKSPDGKAAPKALASPAGDAHESEWEHVRGRVVKVQYHDASVGLKDRWYVVVKLSDGTIRNAMLGKPAVEDVDVCVAMSPDQDKFFDEVVQCR